MTRGRKGYTKPTQTEDEGQTGALQNFNSVITIMTILSIEGTRPEIWRGRGLVDYIDPSMHWVLNLSTPKRVKGKVDIGGI